MENTKWEIDSSEFKKLLKNKFYKKYPEELPNAVMTRIKNNKKEIKYI